MPVTVAKGERELKAVRSFHVFPIDRTAINEKDRTLSLAFSSEAPVRSFHPDLGQYLQVLDHSPNSIILNRVKQGVMPLLVNHDSNDQVGTIADITIETDKKGRAIARFGNSSRAQEIWKDVLDGVRRAVSVAGDIYKLVKEGSQNALDVYRAISWEPYEISIVSVPADPSVGIGRGAGAEPRHTTLVKDKDMNILLDHTPADGGGGSSTATAAQTTEDVRKAEFRRAQELRAIAKRTGLPELATEAENAVQAGTTIEDFRLKAFEMVCKRQGAELTPINNANPEIGLSRKEVKRYSLVRAMNLLANQRPLDGLEKEASDEVAKQTRKTPEGFFVPHDVMTEERRYMADPGAIRREMNTLTGAGGGFLVQTDLLTGNLIELLRNRMITVQLGAISLSGLVGNIAIPRLNAGATAAWLSENATASLSTQTIGQLALTPHRLTAATAYTKTLLAQGSLDVENFIRSDLMSVLAIEKDRGAIAGSGAAGQPTGIYSTTGLSTAVSFATPGTPLWTELIAFETAVANSNADIGRLAYAMSPTARGKLKGLPKAANQAVFMWEADPQNRPGFGLVNGYPAVASKQIPEATNVCFGNWSDVVIADWAGIDVSVNPFSLDTANQVRVVITMFSDIGLRHAASFCISGNGIT